MGKIQEIKIYGFEKDIDSVPDAFFWVLRHNCFRTQSLWVEGLLSTGYTPSTFYLLVEIGLPLHFFQYTGGENQTSCIKKTPPEMYEIS